MFQRLDNVPPAEENTQRVPSTIDQRAAASTLLLPRHPPAEGTVRLLQTTVIYFCHTSFIDRSMLLVIIKSEGDLVHFHLVQPYVVLSVEVHHLLGVEFLRQPLHLLLGDHLHGRSLRRVVVGLVLLPQLDLLILLCLLQLVVFVAVVLEFLQQFQYLRLAG